jgi:hypothetical protein
MSKFIGNSEVRLPREIGKGALPDHPAIKSPWEKLHSFHDCYHYACRHGAVIAQSFMEVLRIVVPDYNERCHRLCESNHALYLQIFNPEGAFNHNHKEVNNCIHPFVCGANISGAFGDSGDERLIMNGRLNDWGTYRAEKELDTCYWDIMGSEICRTSAHVMTTIGECYEGPSMEFKFYEGRGYGDLHCRAIAENREKYPLESKPHWENCEDICTEHLIKFTPREQMYKEPAVFREETGYMFRNGFNTEYTAADAYRGGASSTLGTAYATQTLSDMIKAGEVTQEYVDNIIRAVFRSAGKATFGDFFAIKGVRDWLGVPGEIEDGRVLGGYIEMQLQIMMMDYKIVAFDGDEVIYDIKRSAFERYIPMYSTAYLAMWYGMVKTLVNCEWALWEEEGDGFADDTLRIKIARKIDKRSL